MGERDLVLIDSVDAQETAYGALDAYCSISVCERLHVFGNRPRKFPRPCDLALVQSKFAFIHIYV